MPILDQRLLGNSVQTWLIALGVTVVVLGILWIGQDLVARRLLVLLRRTAPDLDRAIVQRWVAIKAPVQLVLALRAGSLVLVLPGAAVEWLRTATILAALVQVAVWGSGLIAYWTTRYRDRSGARVDGRASGTIAFLLRLLLYAVVVLVALDNIPGIQLTSLIASLGITGIAIALAVQNILTDLFASLAIALDRPFEVGDTIAVDTYEGVVEHIGIKTTRVRSLTGEQIIFANNDLLRSRVRNLQRMLQRRVTFTLRLAYGTPQAQVEALPGMLREMLAGDERIRFVRAHLARIGAAGLDFDVVYDVLSPEAELHVAIQAAINLQLLQRLRDAGIELAAV